MTLDDMLKQATPRPWVVDTHPQNYGDTIYGDNARKVARVEWTGAYGEWLSPEDRANIALAVHAVNHFPALVAALEAVAGMRYAHAGDCAIGHAYPCDCGTWALIVAVTNQVSQALALARNVEASL